ncbi:MPK13 [Symbiodinium natans]|uniref:MPK13 protein n=1 Tax=Symbiodinium natans TaxID=878477 RepID=A0A812MGW4_9DINO|nr:MPK13 [Symbiodinium natans]
MRGAQSQPDFAGIPPSLRQHARNLASWFPEVVAVLGAADLEDKFRQGAVHVREHEAGKTVEVVLPKKEPSHQQVSVPAAAPRDLSQQMARLDRLAVDFESLAAQLRAVNAAQDAGASQACSSTMQPRSAPSVDNRLDAATEEA